MLPSLSLSLSLSLSFVLSFSLYASITIEQTCQGQLPSINQTVNMITAHPQPTGTDVHRVDMYTLCGMHSVAASDL